MSVCILALDVPFHVLFSWKSGHVCLGFCFVFLFSAEYELL